jgi:hypothetical protein
MIKACEDAHLWPELIFLYCHYDEWDNAALAMMERAADAWEHHSFKDVVRIVSVFAFDSSADHNVIRSSKLPTWRSTTAL